MQQLSALACFDHVEAIKPIVAGLSSQCFQVNADNKHYFAKRNPSNNELALSKITATHNVSPQVVFHNELWLINEFISAENLANNQYATDQKIHCAIKLMAQCHQIQLEPTDITQLNPEQVAKTLIKQSHFSEQKKTILLQLAHSLISPLPAADKQVYCHGDINFSNILIASNNKAWLVDFECACIAPREYDLAMFIAVNNIDKERISVIISQYELLCQPVTIDLKLLESYLAFAYLINSLWYCHAEHNQSNVALNALYQQQWQKLTSLINNKYDQS